MKKIFYLWMIGIICTACSGKNNKSGEITEIIATPERGETFNPIDPKDIQENVIRLISEGWMLITAGNQESYNTMTASWGGLGELWARSVATCYVHPDRYTFGFMEKAEYYTLCFFDPEYKEALLYCGTKSGRDYTEKNKAEEAGLTPAYTERGSVYFKEAYMVLECKKLYSDYFHKENFALDVEMKNHSGEISSIYNHAEKLHKLFIGEIVNCRTR